MVFKDVWELAAKKQGHVSRKNTFSAEGCFKGSLYMKDRKLREE